MKKLLIILIFTLYVPTAFADEYAIVANKSFDAITLGEIKALYLKKISFLGDKKIVPLNLSARNEIRKSFERQVLHMSFSRLKSYWSKQHYLGRRPPISLKSQESVKAFIGKVDGAIGYMQVSKVDKRMKILYKWSD